MRLTEGRNRASNIISLGSAKILFYHSTRHEKSGQEVFGLLPAFCCNPLWQLPCFSRLLILFYESLPLALPFSFLCFLCDFKVLFPRSLAYHFFEVSRLQLRLGEGALEAREFQYCAEDAGEQAVAEEHLVVEDKLLQLAALGSHRDDFVRRVERRYHSVRARFEHQRVRRAVLDAYAAAYAALWDDARLLAPVLLDHLNCVDGADFHAFAAADALFRVYPRYEVRAYRLRDAEALYCEHRLAAA